MWGIAEEEIYVDLGILVIEAEIMTFTILNVKHMAYSHKSLESSARKHTLYQTNKFYSVIRSLLYHVGDKGPKLIAGNQVVH